MGFFDWDVGWIPLPESSKTEYKVSACGNDRICHRFKVSLRSAAGIVGKVLAFLSPFPIIGIRLYAASYDSSLVERRSEGALAKAGHRTEWEIGEELGVRADVLRLRIRLYK